MKHLVFAYAVNQIWFFLGSIVFFLVHDFTQKFLDHDFSIEVMIFKLRDESVTNAEIDRQIPTPKCNVTINPVVFKREAVKPVQTHVVQEPILIPPQEFVPVTLLERIQDRLMKRNRRF